MQILVRLALVLTFMVSCILAGCTLKSHNMYPKMDMYVKSTLAFSFVYLVLMCMYWLYRVVTM